MFKNVLNMEVNTWIITLCICFITVQAHISEEKKCKSRCRYSRIHSMKAADCYNKDMTDVPKCLPSDVEVIDFSHNRIRKLLKEDLKKYTSLKILYLNDNLIGVIDKGTFEGKDYLQTLDLSLNALTKVPVLLFQLPSLKSLYLGQNSNMNIIEVIEEAKPITSPLFNLDINNIMSEESNILPDLGLLSTLQKYNISGNKLISVNPKHFAGLCNLKMMDTTNVTVEDDFCNCKIVNKWLKNRTVEFEPFLCTGATLDCPDEVPEEDLLLYQKCIEETIRQSKMKIVPIIIISVCIILVIIAALSYFFVRRRQKQRKKQNPDNAEDVMLNNAVIRKT